MSTWRIRRTEVQYTDPMPQFIYTMKGLGKVHPPDAKVLEDIWLSFYFGAKIGVLGLNGAGKSSLLRIMAGEDQQFLGEAVRGRGGFRRPSPSGAAARCQRRTVRGNVEEGVAPIRALLTRYDELNEKLGEDLSPEAMEKVLDEQSKVQDKIDAANAWDLDSRLELAMDALRVPPADADVDKLSGASAAAWRCAGCCCSRPICCCSTSRPTISTPSRSRGSSGS